MCGICGIIGPPSDSLSETIAEMVSTTCHRGPDGQGTFTNRVDDHTAVALGHNRLSIVDLSEHAAQPMRSHDGRYVLVYNGEVYNYKEIARELDAGDLPDREYGDTEVILAALAKWGPAALPRFNGMWAFLL